MNPISTLEKKLAKLYAGAPHLPRGLRRLLAENAWWVVLVIAIITTLGLIVGVPELIVRAGSEVYSSFYAYRTVPLRVEVTDGAVSLTFGFVSAVLMYLAVGPLKSGRRAGWSLLFLNELLQVAATVTSFIILIDGFNVLGLFWDLVVIALVLYLLFEVRDEFPTRAELAAAAKRGVRSRSGRSSRSSRPAAARSRAGASRSRSSSRSSRSRKK